jgi:hypothetical protein
VYHSSNAGAHAAPLLPPVSAPLAAAVAAAGPAPWGADSSSADDDESFAAAGLRRSGACAAREHLQCELRDLQRQQAAACPRSRDQQPRAARGAATSTAYAAPYEQYRQTRRAARAAAEARGAALRSEPDGDAATPALPPHTPALPPHSVQTAVLRPLSSGAAPPPPRLPPWGVAPATPPRYAAPGAPRRAPMSAESLPLRKACRHFAVKYGAQTPPPSLRHSSKFSLHPKSPGSSGRYPFPWASELPREPRVFGFVSFEYE